MSGLCFKCKHLDWEYRPEDFLYFGGGYTEGGYIYRCEKGLPPYHREEDMDTGTINPDWVSECPNFEVPNEEDKALVLALKEERRKKREAEALRRSTYQSQMKNLKALIGEAVVIKLGPPGCEWIGGPSWPEGIKNNTLISSQGETFMVDLSVVHYEEKWQPVIKAFCSLEGQKVMVKDIKDWAIYLISDQGDSFVVRLSILWT